MKIWLVGSSGMLGSAFSQLLTHKEISFVASEVDITKKREVEAFAASDSFTHIINCAGYTDVERAEEEEALALEVNASGPQHLAEVAKEGGMRLLHFSTDYVFGGEKTTPYKEEAPCAPLNAYGRTKLEGERRLQDAYKSACIIRSSWLFGGEGKNFVRTCLKKMCEKEEVEVVADQRGRPTYTEDLADLAYQLIDHKGIFHVAGSGATTWHAFAEKIRREALLLGFPIKAARVTPVPTSYVDQAARRPAYSVLDTGKVERLLNVVPASWLGGLKRYLDLLYEGKDALG